MSSKTKYTKHRYSGVRSGRKPGSFFVDYIDHKGKRHQKIFYGTEPDAAKYRRALLVKVDRIKAGLEAPPEVAVAVPTLHELWKIFKKDRELKIRVGNMSKLTLGRCKNSFDNFIEYNSELESVPIDEIPSAEFESFMIYRLEKGFSPEGVNIDLIKLKTIFNFAVKKDYLKKSPLADVTRVAVPDKDVRFLDEQELQKLFIALEDINPLKKFEWDARDLVLFYLFTGARQSEILYPIFDWSCVQNNAICFPRTKFSKSRTIPKTATLEQILAARVLKSKGPFRFNKKQVHKRVKWIFEQAGIKNASTHTLRKTAGAWYYMATRDIFATAKFLGHSTVRVTEDHYAGLIQSLKVDYSNQFEAVLNGELQLSCNLETKQDLSGVVSVNEQLDDPRRETESGRYWTRTSDPRLVRAML